MPLVIDRPIQKFNKRTSIKIQIFNSYSKMSQSILNSGLGDRVENHEMLDILYKVKINL